MPYIITTPAKGTNTLHQTRCREVHSRARRMALETLSVMTPHVVNDLPCCDLCLDGNLPTQARAEAWLAHLKAAHNRLAEQRREQERQQRKREAAEVFNAQFEHLRAQCEVMWGQPVRLGSYTGLTGNVAFQLGHETWYDVATIYMLAEDGADRLEVVGINHSTSLIESAQHAHSLSGVFLAIGHWRSPEPLVVPEGAPHFYGIR